MKRITNVFVKVADRWMPDAFVFAIILTAVMFLISAVFIKVGVSDLFVSWGTGFWSMLSFAMQMSLVILFGETFANTPLIKNFLIKVSSKPKTPKQAVIFVGFVAGVAMIIQWGFGLVIGAIVAREVAKRVKGVDFRLLLAVAYSTLILSMVSNTIILKVASDTPEVLSATSNGAITAQIPLMDTLFHPITIITLILLFLSIPFFGAAIHPTPENTVTVDPKAVAVADEAEMEEQRAYLAVLNSKTKTPAERIEYSKILNYTVAIPALYFLYNHFFVLGKSLEINIMNLIFITASLLLYPNTKSFIKAVEKASPSTAGIMLQFPFYGGVAGMMQATNAVGSSLASVVSNALVGFASAKTLPLLVFIIAAILNMFVPSSGGLWVLQAPLAFPAAQALGVNYGLVLMALAWGEMWTNLIQPFWALPSLSIAKLGVRDIMGFCTMLLFLSGIISLGGILIWSFM